MKLIKASQARFVLFFVFLALTITVYVTTEWRSGGREEQLGLVFAPSQLDASELQFSSFLKQYSHFGELK